MKTKLTLFAMVLVTFTLTGCGNMMKAKSSAEPQIEVFHKLFNEQKFSEIYSSSDPAFQKAASEKKLTDLLSSVHRKLGAEKTSTNTNWNASTYNMTTRIVMVQNTIFEEGTAMETFNFVVSDTGAMLLGYNINSTDLIEK